MSDPIPLTELDPSMCYDDMDSTAHASFNSIPSIGDIEHAGVIYKTADGKFCGSTPVTQNLRDDFALRAKQDSSQKIAGIYHVHPGTDDEGQVFSPHDLKVANQLKVPSYVFFQKDSSVRKYVPGQTATRIMQLPGSREGAKVSDGEPVPAPQSLDKQNAVITALRTRDGSQ